MINDKDFQKAIELVNNSDNILITTHARPDGDACGSVAVMHNALTARGKKVTSLLLSEIPEWYEFLFAVPPKVLGKDISFEHLMEGQLGEPDLIIIVDTNSYNQLPQFSEYLKNNNKPVMVIDHHVTTDNLGDVELIDTSAAAVSLIIFDLLKYGNWTMSERIARALFVGIATDTGWFRFSNADNKVYRSAAELMDAGANPTQIYHDLYQNFSLQRFNLMTAMLNTLELHFNGRYATQHLLQADFGRTGATGKDTENLIDECQRIGTVEVAALFVELTDGRIKCSLRSRGAVDVRKIAQKFGGGGHTMASGVHLAGSLQNAKQLIKAEIEEQL